VEGLIREKETGRPLPGLMVCAFDKDVVDEEYYEIEIPRACLAAPRES
jgi:hypothetical protein